ncbi:DUF6636 domain-containing protein [Alysiella filiformis]|uniref:Uncharacterized protein n=1 Tax=Alysiella filiformis DSM 16848 TaxID=1120981 RepID=A0A286E6Y5_9NEIS|nr:DUF6636 domain-containing protein [Alysiella filiformis]QMT31551.1 hypothetical protein H3L97_01170 [Alysiella filiformis]UBQ55436.1 hypothetical protein JF568_07505 [Alysiella filiformis DSM 16848]SOD66672.1 hypothetical protein SAMN02746062_00689 [Alysiella filiformis DSM 16848]
MKKTLLSLILLASSPFLSAQTYSLNFQMPSSNVICGGDLPADESQNRAAWHGVACTMVTPLVLPQYELADQCSNGWGYEFILPAQGAADRPCHTHLPVQFDAPVLKYGAEMRGQGWSCKSEYSGLTCTNQDGSGFKLRKSEQTLFSGSSTNEEMPQPETESASEVAPPESE